MSIRNKATKELDERGANKPCARCGNTTFSLLDDLTNVSLQKNLGVINFNGQNIPTIVSVCNNCGAITLHALGVLGLLNG